MSAVQTYARRLKQARLQAKAGLPMSQEELAAMLGVAKGTISRMERGELLQGITRYELIADVLDRPLSWFFQDDSEEGAV